MLGLVVLLFIGAYLLVSALVVWLAARWARKHNRRAWVWGGLAALAMYNLVFWDWIPTVVMHKYYCATEAGFWIYKTPEQWVKENPGVRETLKQSLQPDRVNRELETSFGERKRFWLTQRFYNDITRTQMFSSLRRTETNFYDASSGELVARSVNYFRGMHGNIFSLGGSPNELRQALILGWGNRQCGDVEKSPTDTFDRFIYQFWKWGENK
jgi:hypothetical protein